VEPAIGESWSFSKDLLRWILIGKERRRARVKLGAFLLGRTWVLHFFFLEGGYWVLQLTYLIRQTFPDFDDYS
jgi:hypothetical protein